MPSQAAVYVRISDDREGRALGVARQEADCRALAERKGWTVAKVYTDNDLSAAKRGTRRPGYEALLSDVKNGAVDALVVWDLDRLHRRPLELEEFFECCDSAGMRHLASVGGDVDLGSGEGLLVARIKGAVAAEEVRKLRARVSRKALELAREGKVGGGGIRPYGYEAPAGPLREDEAANIREAARRVLAGESIRSICGDWNARGSLTVAGAQWHTSSLKRVLTSGRIAGLRDYRGSVVAEAVWPAIIDRPTWEAIRAVLLDPSRWKFDGHSARRYLLTGFLTCGVCGAKLVARPRSDKRRSYVCASPPNFSGCGKIRRLADPVEGEVVARFLHRISRPALARALAAEPEQDPTLTDQLVALDAKLTALATDHYAEGVISRAEFLAAREAIEARRGALRARLAAQHRPSNLRSLLADPGALSGEAWDGLTLDQRRACLAEVIESVIVQPATKGRNTFDPTRIEVRWAGHTATRAERPGPV